MKLDETTVDTRRPTVSRSLTGRVALHRRRGGSLGIMTAEALYPMAAHYNTHTSSVSDLAAMRPDNIVPLALLGAGMIGVGPVPGNHLALHTLFAMTAFVSGGVGALLTAKAQRPSLRVIFRCLGITSLTSLVVGSFLIDWAPVAG